MKRIVSELMLTLLLMGMLTLAIHVSSIQGESTARIYLDPSSYIFDTGNGTLGGRFNVTVRVENVSNLAGFQVRIFYNDSIVNVTRWFEPTWDSQYVFRGNTTMAVPSPPNVSYDHIGPGNGSAMIFVTLMPAGQPTFTGSGKLCIFEFNITAKPEEGQTLSCALAINNIDTYLLDPDIEEIPATKENGYYEFSWITTLPPEPYIAHPLNCSLIYGDEIDVSVGELNLASNIVSTTIEYGPTQTGPWSLIAVDTDPVDGWGAIWNLTVLSEGDYYIRATMVNNVSQAGVDLAHVYFDYTPPIPELVEPTFPTFVSGLTNLTATTLDENIAIAKFWLLDLSWIECTWINKSIPKLNQHNINDTSCPDWPEWLDGDWHCGPTAAASCLAYWDAYVDRQGQRPYKDLYDETRPDGDNDGFGDGLEGMAREIARKADTNKEDWDPDSDPDPDPGTSCWGLRKGINQYIRQKGLACKLEAKWIHRPIPDDYLRRLNGRPDAMRKDIIANLTMEFLDCQDVIARIDGPMGGHFVTISSIHFKVVRVLGIPVPVPVKIDYMDPWDNSTVIGDVDLVNNKIGDKTVYGIITVCPKSRSSVLIGEDTNGTDGWSVPWDTTQLPDAFYLVRATMTDTTGNTGMDLMLVYINNARVTDITPTKTVVGEKYPIDIQVSLENLYVESANFDITLYANETLIGTENVTLATQNSTILKFTWNTTGAPKGNYSISAKTSVLLNETHLSRVEYIDGWILVTIPGDINGDFRVEGKDNGAVAKAYDTRPGDPKWDPNADITGDGRIEGKDVAVVAKYYGTSYP